MKTAAQFLKKQWFTLILIGVTAYGVNWVVVNKRPVGAMTVIEAQAMDMMAMQPPLGVQPVGTAYALFRRSGESRTFPATVRAFSDEDVKTRAAGLVKDVLVYPGDRVVAGQLLAIIEADELRVKAIADSLLADAANTRISSAEAGRSVAQAEAEKAQLDSETARAGVTIAELDIEALESDLLRAESSKKAAESSFADAIVQLKYWGEEYKRSQTLYEGKAISLDELQQTERNRDSAVAKVAREKANVEAAGQSIASLAKRVEGAEAKLEKQMSAFRASLRAADAKSAAAGKADAEVETARAGARAAQASAGVSGQLAGYTELRASADGVVTERLVSPGTPVMLGQTVIKLKVDSQARVQADLPQSMLSRVSVGSGVRLTAGVLVQTGVITSVFPSVDPMTRTFRVEALAPEGFTTGMSVDMEIFLGSEETALTVAKEAVLTDQHGHSFVWTIKEREVDPNEVMQYTCTMHPDILEDGPGLCPLCKMDLTPLSAAGNLQAEKRMVEVSRIAGLYAYIIGGLEEGDEVISKGHTTVFPGMAVQPVEWGESGPVTLPSGSVSGGDHSGHGGDADSGSMDDMGDGSSKDAHAGHGHEAGQFTCPMHPEVVQDGPGSCPICKMDLITVEEFDGDQPAGEGQYVCPMHPEVVQDGPGTCPICKMDLVPDKDAEEHVCPMHEEVVKDGPGTCPICKMDLVPVKSEKTE
jgi:multidrug efflux pump subunit AcrA (membrane-fusion protein)